MVIGTYFTIHIWHNIFQCKCYADLDTNCIQ